MPRPITRGLRRHGVEVLTAQEDGTSRWEDADLLDRATLLDRVLFSQDEDLLIEAANRQRDRVPFNGLIYAPQLALSIGQCIEDLEILAKAGVLSDFANLINPGGPPLARWWRSNKKLFCKQPVNASMLLVFEQMRLIDPGKVTELLGACDQLSRKIADPCLLIPDL